MESETVIFTFHQFCRTLSINLQKTELTISFSTWKNPSWSLAAISLVPIEALRSSIFSRIGEWNNSRESCMVMLFSIALAYYASSLDFPWQLGIIKVCCALMNFFRSLRNCNFTTFYSTISLFLLIGYWRNIHLCPSWS